MDDVSRETLGRRNYTLRRGPKWVDKTGERSGRLLAVRWVGYWRGYPYWLCLCDCGREVVRRWQPGNTRSCGCLNVESIKSRDFRILQDSGRWGLNNAKPVVMSDGRRFESVHAMARVVGISPRAMKHRLDHWPEDRWLSPGLPRGPGVKRHARNWKAKTRQRWKAERAQPWARANIAKVNERRKHDP